MYEKLNDILGKDSELNLNAVLISSPHNLRYFSGFAGGEGYALTGDGFRYIFVDSRYTEEAKAESPDFNVVQFGLGGVCAEIQKVIQEFGVARIGFEDKTLTYREYKTLSEKLADIELVPLGNRADLKRMIKTDAEIERMRTAERIGDVALGEVLPYIKTGARECDIAAELEYRMRKHGAERTSFETIVVSGEKSAMPHGKPNEKRLERGDFVTIDFGCVYNGYCSDMTRTFVMGEISKEQKKVYDTVLAAQKEGLKSIRSGVCGAECDLAARRVIEDAGYGKYFGHALGHGVGVEIHELPTLSPKSKIILKENMAVTCEPGIYIGGIGGVRIEDLVIVKKDGYDNLSSFDKNLIICE